VCGGGGAHEAEGARRVSRRVREEGEVGRGAWGGSGGVGANLGGGGSREVAGSSAGGGGAEVSTWEGGGEGEGGGVAGVGVRRIPSLFALTKGGVSFHSPFTAGLKKTARQASRPAPSPRRHTDSRSPRTPPPIPTGLFCWLLSVQKGRDATGTRARGPHGPEYFFVLPIMTATRPYMGARFRSGGILVSKPHSRAVP